MAKDKSQSPRSFPGVMISSTFTDLQKHRAAVVGALNAHKFHPVVMEYDSALPDIDVIKSSLKKVEESAAYVAIISFKYGQIPIDPERNPAELSLTELEFNRALELERPILLFIMGGDHDVKPGNVDSGEAKTKLDAFRERAKRMNNESAVHRVYKIFNSLKELEVAANQSVAVLPTYIVPIQQKPETPEVEAQPPRHIDDPIPQPPALYTEPPYIGSHTFVGRQAQLDTLNDWATAADPHPVLLFEAIGGAGKSMLTWEWINNHSTKVRTDWAGRFWYSFYERGAIMADFCARAMAYITGQPLDDFRKQKTAVLAEKLLRHLQTKPYLFVLDGLERVLVSYHRFDAAQLADENAGTTDEIAHRDPCAAIRPEDDDLLRTLAGAAPSKILITSRLIPRVLLNSASQPIPGVLRERLPGLRAADAESLLRSCGVRGDSRAIQEYLQKYCDCHPLVIGVIGGMVNDFFHDRGNFDAWVADPEAGGALNLADLDLVQKRNHILRAAIGAVPLESRKLLSLLALLSEAVDAGTLGALNPFLPPEPKEMVRPERPEDSWQWGLMRDNEKEQALRDYGNALKASEVALTPWRRSPEYRVAERELAKAALDLEHRGLLQYDPRTWRYDLHPVVRGVVAGGLRPDETDGHGQRVVDYFSRQAHNLYDHAETIEDLRLGLQLVRALQRTGRFQAAAKVYRNELSRALLFNLEAHSEVLALIKAFFPGRWDTLPQVLDENDASYLLNDAALALNHLGEDENALDVYGLVLETDLRRKEWRKLRVRLSNLGALQLSRGNLSRSEEFYSWALDLAALIGNQEDLFRARLDLFWRYAVRGAWNDAETMWQALDPMGRAWNRATYRPGYAECLFAQLRFWRGELLEETLGLVERLAQGGRNRPTLRWLHALRGEWMLEQRQWARAAENLQTAVTLAHEVCARDVEAETNLAIAKFQLGRLADPRQVAELLASAKHIFPRGMAELWLLVGDTDEAKRYALAAYRAASADGEPYVFRYELDKSRALLERLGVEIPNLPPYDPAKDEPLPWEAEVVAAIEKLRAEKEAEAKKKAEKKARKTTAKRSEPTKRPSKPRTKK